jgi:hypothetical protein
MVTVLRPLSISELLDRTFHLYRSNFLLFLGIVALPQLAVFALQLGSAAMAFGGQPVSSSITFLVAVLASYVALEISQAVTVIAVSNLHLDRPVSIRSAFSEAWSSLYRVFGITFLVGIAVVVGMILLLVPGIYVALMLSLAIPVAVLEGRGQFASIARSRELTKASRGRIFVICLLIGILALVVSMVIQFPLFGIALAFGRTNPGTLLGTLRALQAAGTFLSTSLVGSLGTIALTLVYYDLRVRKEGFDLQLMMSRLEPNSQAAAAGTPGS